MGHTFTTTGEVQLAADNEASRRKREKSSDSQGKMSIIWTKSFPTVRTVHLHNFSSRRSVVAF